MSAVFIAFVLLWLATTVLLVGKLRLRRRRRRSEDGVDLRTVRAADALCRSIDGDVPFELAEDLVEDLPDHEQEVLILLTDSEGVDQT